MKKDNTWYVENFDIEDYINVNYVDVYWEARRSQNYKYWSNGRIWVITDLINQSIILPGKEGNWDDIIDPKNYPKNIQDKIQNIFNINIPYSNSLHKW